MWGAANRQLEVGERDGDEGGHDGEDDEDDQQDRVHLRRGEMKNSWLEGRNGLGVEWAALWRQRTMICGGPLSL